MKSMFNRRCVTRWARRIFFVIQTVLWAFLLPAVAHAQCSQGSGGVYAVQITLPASVTVPRDAAIGTVLAQGTTNLPFNESKPPGVYCTAATTAVFANNVGGPAVNRVMPTSVQGIGYTVTSAGNANTTTTVSLPASFFSTPSACNNPSSGKCYGYLGTPVTVALVKTGTITGTPTDATVTVPGGLYFTLTVGGVMSSTVSIANSVRVAIQTCVVTTPSVAVSLGTIKSSTFSGIGSTSAAVPFQIGLNCSGVTAKVWVTFTDVNRSGNSSTALSLGTGSSATGVGIQILSGGSPVGFGPDSSVAGNTNQILIGATNSLSNSIPFSARYVQTGSTITPGSANGAATFTMSYQ